LAFQPCVCCCDPCKFFQSVWGDTLDTDRWHVQAGTWVIETETQRRLIASEGDSLVTINPRCNQDEYTTWYFSAAGDWEEIGFTTPRYIRLIFNWVDADNYDCLQAKQQSYTGVWVLQFFSRVDGEETETTRHGGAAITPSSFGHFDFKLVCRWEAGHVLTYGAFEACGATYGPDYVQASKVFGLATGAGATAGFTNVTLQHYADARVTALTNCATTSFCQSALCDTEAPPAFSVVISDITEPTPSPPSDYHAGASALNGTYYLERGSTGDWDYDPVCGWVYTFDEPVEIQLMVYNAGTEEYEIGSTYSITKMHLRFTGSQCESGYMGLHLGFDATGFVFSDPNAVANPYYKISDCGAISDYGLTGVLAGGNPQVTGNAALTGDWPA
jgi:hypothetical protein